MVQAIMTTDGSHYKWSFHMKWKKAVCIYIVPQKEYNETKCKTY